MPTSLSLRTPSAFINSRDTLLSTDRSTAVTLELREERGEGCAIIIFADACVVTGPTMDDLTRAISGSDHDWPSVRLSR